MKKSINNFSKGLPNASLNKIKGGHLGKGYSRPKTKNSGTSCGSGHVTVIK